MEMNEVFDLFKYLACREKETKESKADLEGRKKKKRGLI